MPDTENQHLVRDGGHHESHLDLQFLLPTSAGMSMSQASLGASQASMLGAGGLENSTFNLADLIASQMHLNGLDANSVSILYV